MDEMLRAAYLATIYRVRLARGGWAGIHIGKSISSELLHLVGAAPWAVLTAWNPYSIKQSNRQNHAAQHQLLNALRHGHSGAIVRPAIGVGQDGWREPSFLIIGIDVAQLDVLARHFRQHAYVHGDASGIAQLRWVN